jgi:hypothetical protein
VEAAAMVRTIRRILAGLSVAALAAGCDYVIVRDSAGEAGLLVDGQNRSNAAIVNDRGRTRDVVGEEKVSVGSLVSAASPNRNEVIAFGENRAPARAGTPWTDSTGDEFPVTLQPRLGLPVTVWIVQGPFADQRAHAIDACIQTSAIWDAERMGIRFTSFVVRDATNDPDIDNAILNSTGGDSRNWNDFSNDIGFDANRVNIYWINTVEGSTTTGWSDFGGRIVMGRNTGDELLVHELGHAFNLLHPVGCGGSTANFDATNVMWQCSSTRQFLTEGQVFRVHFNPGSSVNALYNARPGQPTAGCQAATQTAECPALNRRLWDDGTYPAN